MAGKFSEIHPVVNPSTILDGRGGIFTFELPVPVVELNLLIIKSGKVRGYHSHKHFTEIFMVVSGRGVYTAIEEDGRRHQRLVSGGEVFVIEPGVRHVLHAVETLTCVAGLSSLWRESNEPITPCPSEDVNYNA